MTESREAFRAAKGGVQLSFEFGSSSKANSLINTNLADSGNKQEVVDPLEENPILKKILMALASSVKQQVGKKGKSVGIIWQALASLSDTLATYLGDALERSNLAQDFGSFLESCFKESGQAEDLSECIYEAIETTCGIRTSVKGFLSCQFVINCMSLANMVKNLVINNLEAKAEQRFIQFIKEVLMQQIFETEDARLLVLDTLCMLCQDLSS